MLKGLLKSGFDFYLYSNLHIALCAVALLNVSCSILQIQFSSHLYYLVFFGTLFLYCFQRLIGVIKRERIDFLGDRNQWNFSHRKTLITLIFLSLFPLFYSLFKLNLQSKLVILFAAILSFVYAVPIINFRKKKIRARDFPIVKIFFIALVWVLITVFLPAIESKSVISVTQLVYWAVIVFLVIIALTIPFDVRDLEFDDASLRTLPMLMGEMRAVRFAQLLLLISSLILLFAPTKISPLIFAPSYYLLWSSFSILFLHNCSKSKSEYYFSFSVDGLIILLWVCSAIQSYI